MKPVHALFLSLLLLAGAPAVQAQGSAAALPAVAAPREAAQFDFLLGQWEIELSPKTGSLVAMMHGTPKLVGSWKAWRAFDGFGIDDELRVIDASGNPTTLSHAQRIYDGKTRRWLISSLDVYRTRFASATAQWQDGEMRVSGSGTTPDGKPLLTRSRFFEIGPDRFRMRQDRSSDDGASWDEGVLMITAKRVAPKAPR
ncbi:hypothetical protein BH11PSE10_BH11PSE10_20810 [soil metagenome]